MPKKMPNQISVGNFIQLKRSELNYTQEYLARVIGVTKTAVSNWENGVSMVDVKYLVPLANVFGVRIDNLLFPSFQFEKNEFYYYTDLFKQMLDDKLQDKSVCDKIIELYIQCKIEVSTLLKEYFITEDETIIEKIQRINKFGLRFCGKNSSIDHYQASRWLEVFKKHQDTLNEKDICDWIDTGWYRHDFNIDGTIYKEADSAFYTYLKIFFDRVCEETSDTNANWYYYFMVNRSILFEKIVCNCSSSLAVKYIKTFSQEYKNSLIKSAFKSKKQKIDSLTKKILKILLRAGCRYIKDGEDLTHLVYEKCI